ncbi:MAG: methylated-DNA--[protein]-cysteine S-methyltransferase [Planctomycetota bacterium]|nr:methylated-DNA--[protein]-cysteine S-methyltransferase [Planctomycetota bacterium]
MGPSTPLVNRSLQSYHVHVLPRQISFETEIGTLQITWSQQGIRSLHLPTKPQNPSPSNPTSLPGTIRRLIHSLIRWSKGINTRFPLLPLDLDGYSRLEKEVYHATQQVAWGQVSTYGQIARDIDRPRAARAVGRALGKNPIPLLIPCHRILTSTGSIGGFSAPGGIPSKYRLLALEEVFVPQEELRRSALRLTPPENFHLENTVTSHGWFDLSPFRWQHQRKTLTVPFHLTNQKTTTAQIRQSPRSGCLQIHLYHTTAELQPDNRKSLRRSLKRMFQFHQDIDSLENLRDEFPHLRKILSPRRIRLLAASSVFEDVIKTLATTNCSWNLTRQITRSLVHELGYDAPGGLRTFPTASTLARTQECFLRQSIRAGYRAPFILELARRVDAGEIDPESWPHPEQDPATVRHQVSSIRGLGPYGTSHLMRLLGHFEELSIDSWCRRRYRTLFPHRKHSDSAINKHYQRYGKLRGLVFWLELTRDWHDASGRFVLSNIS